MGQTTNIAWCDHTFNPWWGCVKVSRGCEHCYMQTFLKRVGQERYFGPSKTTQRRFFSDKHWLEPRKWNREAEVAGVRRRVFCASMADVFEDNPALVGERVRLFRLIESTPSLDWLLLTKRPENLLAMLPHSWTHFEPMPNVWLGTSVEDQRAADERIPLLLQTPAAVRFLSAEPLLGPVELFDTSEGALRGVAVIRSGGQSHDGPSGPSEWFDDSYSGIDWVIAGGESGPNYRPLDLDWARSLRDQCTSAGVSYFFKQIGGRTHAAGGRLLDGRTWDQFPEPAREGASATR
jgi:protein gp37